MTIPTGVAGLRERINEYLAKGGLFNPEYMEHFKVRELLIDCREALAAEPQVPPDLREQLAAITCRGCNYGHKRVPFTDGSGALHEPYPYHSSDDYLCTDKSEEILKLLATASRAKSEEPQMEANIGSECKYCDREGWSKPYFNAGAGGTWWHKNAAGDITMPCNILWMSKLMPAPAKTEQGAQPEPYRAVNEGGGCKECHHGDDWTVVYTPPDGSEEIGEGETWNNPSPAEEMADSLNDAFGRGWRAARVRERE